MKKSRIRIEIKAEFEWAMPAKNKHEEIRRQQMQIQLDYLAYQCRDEVKKFFNRKLEEYQKTVELQLVSAHGQGQENDSK